MTELIIILVIAVAIAITLTRRLGQVIRSDGYGHRTPPGSHHEPFPRHFA